jgi:threonine dehydratase
VLCGGNIDLHVIGRIIERGLALDGRLCRINATISDRPGGLASLTRLLADAGASVRDLQHDRNFAGQDVATVDVRVTLETRDAGHASEVVERLRAAGVKC